MEKSFSEKKALSFGWETFKASPGFFILVFLIPFLLSILLNSIQESLAKAGVMTLIFAVGSSLISILIQIGLVRIVLKFVDRKRAEIADLFSGGPFLLDFILASLFYFLIVVAGLVLFIVPGIIWAIKYQFCTYLVIDKKLGPIEAIRKSGQITKGVRWPLLGLALILFLVNLGGALLLGLGLLVTVPVTSLAYAYVYRQLEK